MKLIRWVEVHIGRSRRKSKKDKESNENKVNGNASADVGRCREESISVCPIPKFESVGNEFIATRSAGSTPRRMKQHSSPQMSVGAPGTPLASYLANKMKHHQQQQQQYMRSFPDPSPVPSLRGLSTLDTGSPRQRSRIRTNPWLPSPRSSRDSGLERKRSSSFMGSDSSEFVSGSGFSSQSSGSIWDEPWSAFRGGGRSPLVTRLPRSSLEGSPCRKPTMPNFAACCQPCSATFSRPIPRSGWIDFREVNTALLAADESSDEAYSEDFAEEEHSDEQDDHNVNHDAESPQADSACGSDRDNSSSCSTTPLSETATSSQPSNMANSSESLHDKVQRLRLEQQIVHKRVLEAREEEIVRREEQIVLRKEIVQFRRLILLQTLTDLRDQLEKRYDNLSSSASWLQPELT